MSKPHARGAGAIAAWRQVPRAFRFGHAAIGLILLIAVWSAALLGLAQLRQADTRDAAAETGNIARAFGLNVQSTVDAADQTLRAMGDVYASDPGGFDLDHWSRSQVFPDRVPLAREIDNVRGRPVLSSIDPGAAALPAAARADAIRGAIKRNGGLYIGQPVADPATGRITLPFGRTIRGYDGALTGFVLLGMDPAALHRMYASLQVGAGAVTIAKQDGTLLTCAPACVKLAGALDPDTLAADAVALASADNVSRLYSVRPVGNTGLDVFLGLAAADVYHDYRRDRIFYFAGAGLLTLALLVDNLIILLQRRRILAVGKALGASVENISHGIVMTEADGTIAVINRRAIALLRLPEDFDQRQAAAAGAIGRDPANAKNTGDVGDRLVSCEERVMPDGTVLEILHHAIPGGGSVSTFTDITERKRQDLSMAEARDALEAGLRAKSQFLTTISHELRTPLNGINGLASLLRTMVPQGDAASYVSMILESGEQLLQLTNDILDVIRLDSGKFELEIGSFRLGDMIDSVFDAVRPNAGKLTLVAEIDPSVPAWLSGDAARLRKILLNLVETGIKFTEAGSVTVVATAARREDGAVRLEMAVSAGGIGVAPNRQQEIFDAFNQLGGSGKRRSEGTGVGLAVTRRLIERMAGSISAESAPGSGRVLRFSVILGGAGPHAAVDDTVSGQVLNVLVAEDNTVNRLVVTRMLERMGHRADSVENGRLAVEAFASRGYDLILMDLMMPEMDGLQATSAIRALPPPHCHVPIIALTANVLTADASTCIAAGMDAYLSKPVTSDRLQRAMRQVVGPRESGPERNQLVNSK